MKPINKNELFQNISSFLKSKGVDLQEGSYTQRIQQGCGLVADAANATQRAATRAKVTVNQKLGQLRQSIHKATAPKPGATQTPPAKRKANTRAKPSRKVPAPKSVRRK